MHPALIKLTWMLLKGWVRRQFSGGTILRTIFGTLGALMFLMWILVFALRGAFRQPFTLESSLLILPVVLTVFGVLPILLGNDDRGLAFTPAEIDFLFPGPFSRRNLVFMKLFRMLLGTLSGAIFFGMSLRMFSSGIPQSILGTWLALVFTNLLSTIAGLVRDTVRDRWYALARYGAIVALVLLIGGGAWYTTTIRVPTPEELRGIAESTPARVVLAPARVFAHVFMADSLGEVAAWALACVGINLGALLVLLALDKGYMSAALAASERRQAKLARLGKGGIATGKPARSIALPSLHGLGPIGAIIKRQLITAVRTSRAWMLMLLFGLAYGYLMSRFIGHSEVAAGEHAASLVKVGALMPAAAMLAMMLPQMLRFDFRGDLDHIESLKSMPISPLATAMAELAVPTLILSAQGWMILAGAAVFVGLPSTVVVMGCLAMVPLAAMLFALENFVFLIVPTRIYAPGQAATVFSGRRLLFVVARLAILGVGGGTVAVFGIVVWLISGSVWATFSACWIALVAIAASMLPAVAWAFHRFDVSTDMPA